jgi:hypothetical protein
MDAMSDNDPCCDGCLYISRSYAVEPCNVCSRIFPEMQRDYYAALVDDGIGNRVEEVGNDPVKRPNHYMLCDMEAIDVIKASLTTEEYKGYLKGNMLKYRLRAGKKDDTQQDIRKALEYEEIFDMNFGE